MAQLFRQNILLLIFASMIFFISISTKNLQTSSDPLGTLLTSQAIIETQSIKLDSYNTSSMSWHLYENKEHKYYYFPIGSSLSSIPFVYIATKVFDLDMNIKENDRLLQRIITSFLCVSIFYLLFKISNLYLNKNLSVYIALFFWLGTSFSSTLATALWNQGFAVFYSAIAVYLTLLIKEHNQDKLWPFLSIALFLAYLSRPTLSLLSIVIVLFIFLSNKKTLAVKTSCLVAAFLILFTMFSFYEYKQILPPYYLPKRLDSDTFWTAMYGNILSPSRGILIFSPFLCLFFINIDKMFKIFNETKVLYLFLVWILTHLIIISKFPHWWGGGSFGSRFMIDVLLPIFYIFILLTKELIKTKGYRYKISLLFLVISFISAAFINTYQGLYNKYSILWFLETNIDQNPKYIFDWNYPQFLHNEKRHLKILKEFKKEERINELYKGVNLPTKIGTKDGEFMSIKEKENKKGLLTFGPYILLYEGKYEFTISYISTEEKGVKVGYWDVFLSSNNSNELLKKGPIKGSNNKDSKIFGNFIISNKYDYVKLEIRNYYNGKGDLSIENIRIKKVN